MADVDLERLAAAYDHRVEDGAVQRAGIAADTTGLGPGSTVVDVGGGRGVHASVFTERGTRAVVVDPSPAMVLSSQRRGVVGVVARGESLPIRDGAADLVYFHLSIHHGAWRDMLAEAARVVGNRGHIWVWTLADAHHENSYLARWFPSVGAIDAVRFPPVEGLRSRLTELGLVVAPTVAHHDRISRPAGAWMSAVRAGFVSTLHLVPAEEIEAGLVAFGSQHPDPSESIEYDLPYVGLHAEGPGLVS
ncbi:MAG TPA: methyltransferase domain-containing protein [Acidimicrobiia bacterium]|nr:methyltransferase domain-containing protein [Acidimicrobiia bacterium]